MIQRIQSLFLLLIAACMTATAFVGNWEEAANGKRVELSAMKMTVVQAGAEASSRNVWYIAALALVAAAIAAYSLSQYKNRTTQTGLGAMNALVMAGVLGLIIYFSREAETVIPNNEGVFKIGTYLPMAALTFNILANRFIRRDEKLVRSADRMR